MSVMISSLEAAQIVAGRKQFRAGDTVKIHYRIVEGKNERIQIYEGIVIAFRHGGTRETFTVRKISLGEGVERVFPLWSSRVDSIELVRRGSVRRAKLYYLRSRRGKSARIKERRDPRVAKSAAPTEGAAKS